MSATQRRRGQGESEDCWAGGHLGQPITRLHEHLPCKWSDERFGVVLKPCAVELNKSQFGHTACSLVAGQPIDGGHVAFGPEADQAGHSTWMSLQPWEMTRLEKRDPVRLISDRLSGQMGADVVS